RPFEYCAAVLYVFELIDLELIARRVRRACADDAPGLRIGEVGVGRRQLARSSGAGAAVFLNRGGDWTAVDHRGVVGAGHRHRHRLGHRAAIPSWIVTL